MSNLSSVFCNAVKSRPATVLKVALAAGAVAGIEGWLKAGTWEALNQASLAMIFCSYAMTGVSMMRELGDRQKEHLFKQTVATAATIIITSGFGQTVLLEMPKAERPPIAVPMMTDEGTLGFK